MCFFCYRLTIARSAVAANIDQLIIARNRLHQPRNTLRFQLRVDKVIDCGEVDCVISSNRSPGNAPACQQKDTYEKRGPGEGCHRLNFPVELA